MRSLTVAREVCERFHSGLLDELEKVALAQREAPESPVVEIYRRHAGAGLLAPAEFGGQHAGPLDAARIQRAVASVSPSLGVAATMHHFTVATLFRLAGSADRLTPAQTRMLSSVAGRGLLMASGWAEGRTDQNILTPSVVAQPTTDGYRVSGTKKPCSLAKSMDILTASAQISEPDGRVGLALLLIPADSPGITVRPFWSTPVLAGAQSHEVQLANVEVPDELVIRSTPADQHALDDLQTAGFTWFELLATSTYVGAAATLVERVIEGGRGDSSARAALAVRLEAAVGLVEGVARGMEAGLDGDEAVASVLVARYATQDLLAEVVHQAVELLGGMAFIGSPDVAYLASAVHALAFHPPSRASAAEGLARYFAGEQLRLS